MSFIAWIASLNMENRENMNAVEVIDSNIIDKIKTISCCN